MKFKRGQLTIFIIIAIIIVAAVAGFFLFREKIGVVKIPSNLEPVYTTFLSCLEEDVLTGISILESQGGYIEVPDFSPGSIYMPFSSHLNFLGNPIPYWYYVSGNGIEREQVPSKTSMEEQLEDFIKEQIRGCVFDEYYEQGFEITQGEPEVSIIIRETNVIVDLNMDLTISKGDDNAFISEHKISAESSLGNLYDSAIELYNYEQKTLFLENYAVDTLRLYAPVDGVELTCSPLTWEANEIFEELLEAIEANTLALKIKGGDYSLTKEENKYFIVDVSVDVDNVRFLNSKSWSYSFEVSPSQGSVLIAEPVGTQAGLGILGFCYVPYHFVYNINYPVLVQLYSGNEIFQFPLAVVVQGNQPREALDASAGRIEESELCKYKNALIEVYTYDSELNSIESKISYECIDSTCEIGETKGGFLRGEFPQCVNGYILATSEGFEDVRYLYSTIEDGRVDIIFDKLYEIGVGLNLDGISYNQNAIINFISDDSSSTIVYPDTKTVELSERQYEVQVYIYQNSSLKIEESVYEQCVEVTQSGLGGLFGLTEEKCFDVKIPEQIISNVLSGGGIENYYILESELQNSNVIEINAESLSLPKSLEDLQENYLLFEEKGLDIYFK